MNTQSSPSTSSCSAKACCKLNHSLCTGLLLIVFGAAIGAFFYAFPESLGIKPEHASATALSFALACGAVGAFLCAKGILRLRDSSSPGAACCSAQKV